jgi:hypothetical protein
LGTVKMLDSGDFMIEQSFLLKQEVTSVETELSNDGIYQLIDELLLKGDEGLEQVNLLHFWGHSHVRMFVNPSGTDERTMDRFGEEGHEWYLRGIFNKLGDVKFTIYYYKKGYRIIDAPWSVMDPETGKILVSSPESFDTLHETLKPSAELRAEITAEYKAKVHERGPYRWNEMPKKTKKSDEKKKKDKKNRKQNKKNRKGKNKSDSASSAADSAPTVTTVPGKRRNGPRVVHAPMPVPVMLELPAPAADGEVIRGTLIQLDPKVAKPPLIQYEPKVVETEPAKVEGTRTEEKK